jgi:Septum formation
MSPRHQRTIHLCGLTLALAALVPIAGCAPAREGETGELVQSGEIAVSDLEVGTCLANVPDAASAADLEALPCSEPHSDEIYASGTLSEAAFPGVAAVEAAARDICLAEFEGFVGIPYDDSVLDIAYLAPTEDGWRSGDRAVLCTIFDPAEEVSGSLRGVER